MRVLFGALFFASRRLALILASVAGYIVISSASSIHAKASDSSKGIESLEDYKDCIIEGAGRSPMGSEFQSALRDILKGAAGDAALNDSLLQLDIARMPVNMGLEITNDGTQERDGKKSKEMSLSWGEFNPLKFKNADKARAEVAKVCRMKYPDLAEPYCVDSFLARKNIIENYLSENHEIYDAMAKEIVAKKEIDLNSMASYFSRLPRVKIVDNINQLGNTQHLFLGSVHLNGPVLGEDGSIYGMNMSIENGDQDQNYICPFAAPIPAGAYAQILAQAKLGLTSVPCDSPYPRSFTKDFASTWNKYMEQKFNTKFVNL